ncbi:MAG: RNA-binding protein [Nitrososphaerota archaeon]|nr:hypothetical protein [Nitrososphaerales archaeon]MCX8191184.1 hypothetical protein [Nitrososphaerales archaeon]MDW8044567.1 RNA-binding protein [Nitrososphaerota archaeon]
MSQLKTVIVGTSKPILNYVTACITIFNQNEKSLMIRARGKAINVAVDVVQLLTRSFLRDVTITKINIDGEKVNTKSGKQITLPVLEITLSRQDRMIDVGNTKSPIYFKSSRIIK